MNKILVADDDESVREMYLSIFKLMKLADRIIFAIDGRDALVLFQNHKDEIGLVITDQKMPHMEGHQLVGEILSLGYKGKVILISGTLAADVALSCGVDVFLKKPFEPKDFITAVEENFNRGA